MKQQYHRLTVFFLGFLLVLVRDSEGDASLLMKSTNKTSHMETRIIHKQKNKHESKNSVVEYTEAHPSRVAATHDKCLTLNAKKPKLKQ